METMLKSTEQPFTVEAVNNSTQFSDFCLIQSHRDAGANLFSLAWLVHRAWPSTQVRFEWTTDYCFVWGETGVLRPGVNFFAGEVVPAALDANNQITLDYQYGAFRFINPSMGQPGSLTIQNAGDVPINTGAVGIGMSGQGTAVLQAMPNMNFIITPKLEYWIAAGVFQQGEVLNVEALTRMAQIEFPPNIYNMVATLDQDNNWTISQGE